MTLIVIVVMVAMAIFLGLIDLGASHLLAWLVGV